MEAVNANANVQAAGEALVNALTRPAGAPASLQLAGIKNLVRQNPMAVRTEVTRGTGHFSHRQLPLHHALERGCALPIIQFLVEEYPESIRIQNTHRRSGSRELPLHIACLSGAPLPVVQYLYQQYPDAICTKCGMGSYLPLHFAGRGYGPEPLNVVKYLVEHYPQGVSVGNY